jgi:ferrochelatase
MPETPELRTAVVLAQLGTPDAPTYGALWRYLREFLSDPKVIDKPRWLWLPILYGPILTFRPRTSAKLYKKIWTPEGSPLLIYSRQVASMLQDELGSEARVELGMRYGNPSLEDLLIRLCAQRIQRILLVPLFPQYSETTTGSVVELAQRVIERRPDPPELEVFPPYFDQPLYIETIAAMAKQTAAEHGPGEKWVFSFHGIPQSYADKGDPYPKHCEVTAQALADALRLPEEAWILTYQSRVGPDPWLQPYTDEVFESLGKEGLGRIYVICPGFAADCLETIDEIAEIGQEQFAEAGGGDLHLVPALNSEPGWVLALATMVRRRLAQGPPSRGPFSRGPDSGGTPPPGLSS